MTKEKINKSDSAQELRESIIVADSEAFLSSILATTNEAIISIDAGQNIILFNSGAEQVFGYTEDEVLGKSIEMLIPPEFRSGHAGHIRAFAGEAVISRRMNERSEVTGCRKDGETFPAEASITKAEVGGQAIFTVILRDITRRKNTENALYQSETRYRSIIDNMADTFYRTDIDGRVIMASPAVEELLGYTPDEAIGMELASLYVDPEGRAKFLEALASSDRGVRDYRAEIWRKDGSSVWVSSNARYVRDGEGNITGVEGTVRNITEQKQAEEAAVDSHDQLRMITDNVAGRIIYIDADRRYRFVNKGVEELFGLPREDIIGKRGSDIQDPADYQRLEPHIELALAGKHQTFEQKRANRDGTMRDYQTTYVPQFDAQGQVLGCYILSVDITDRKRVEKALAESRDQLRLVTDNLPVLIVYIDDQKRYRFANKTCAEWYALPIRDILKKSVPEVLGGEFAKLDSRIARTLAGEQQTFVETVTYPDGVTRAVQITYIPHRKADGSINGYFSLTEDISELQRTEEALRQAQKMEAVGQLTGGVAHDFNNLLAVILGNTELLHDEIGDNRQINLIDRAATRGAELTQRLLAFSRQQALQPRSIDLTELLPNLDELFRRTLGAQVKIVTQLPESLWPVAADPGQLESALLNLAINARDAMPEGGVLEIKCENVQVPGSGLRLSDEVAAGDYVQITVSDTGSGMPAGVLEHAFEPFYTTKDVGEGSGLGLSMVYGFTRQSGGDATIESEPGKGTEIKLFLPRSEVTTMSDEPLSGKDRKRGQGEVILILEDDPDVRSFAVSALEGLGYQVHQAADAAEAMQVLEKEADKLDLLLSDVVLPGGVSGPEFAAKAKDLFPELKLVFMSGYAADLYTDDKVPGFDEALLTKPFRLAELSKAIHDALAL